MKVKVLKKFRDAKNGEIREKGATFECSQERYEEIITAGEYVEAAEDEATEDETAVCDIAQMDMKELKAQAKEKGIKGYSTMTKEELVNSLS